MHTLKIINLKVTIENKTILENFNLEMKSGEIHAIMGPNGTGKSTLTRVIMGDENYKIEEGEIYYDDILLNTLKTDERARLGLFLAMQNPIEIEGVTNADLLRTSLSIKEQANFNLFDFIKQVEQTAEMLNMNKDMIHRDINVGFSGGERKKNEILQMYMLKPSMLILDEIDSGLDVDALKTVGNSVMDYYNENAPMILLVTHYKRLLDYINPHFVHIMTAGKIVKTGDAQLVDLIEENGYEKIIKKNSTVIIEEKKNNE